MLPFHLIQQPVTQALFQRREFAGKILHRAVDAAWVIRETHAPDLLAFFAAEFAKALVEARNQVALGHQHIDRGAYAQLVVQFLQAAAQIGRMLPAVGRALLQQVLDVDRQDHAVQRTQRPGTAQHLQKVGPARRVHDRV